MSQNESRIRIPHFPPYGEVRHLLQIWNGWSRKELTGLNQSIWNLTGTPQDIVDWTNPDEWIAERLVGKNRELATLIWEQSGKTVNPRYTYGHWSLIHKYNLLSEASDGKLQLTKDGQEFVNHDAGQTVQCLDEPEGLVALLSMIEHNEPTRVSEILEDWGHHLELNSNFRSPATFMTCLRSRINNLLARGLIERDGVRYSPTSEGSTYLGKFKDASDDPTSEFHEWLKHQKNKTREDLLERLRSMDPWQFEHLVKCLIVRMGYENAEVTASSGDGGVDVTANIEVGITSVKEVIQVKRHGRTTPPKDLDALRGSLYRFGAIRGTLITTSKFSNKTKKAALDSRAQPITLIDGEKLVDLLIEHEIGVRKHTIYLPVPLPRFEAEETGGDE